MRNQISQFVIECLKEKKKSFQRRLPPHFLLEVLEQYDRRLSGTDWDEVKKELSEKVLLPRARKWCKSWFWIRKNFSARVFALTPFIQDEALILGLINDRFFLVRSIASAALIRLESFKGVLKTLENMNQEPGYPRFCYLDLLSQGSSQVFSAVAKIGQTHPELCFVCLKVFSIKTAPVTIPFLQESLKNPNQEIQIAALEAILRNPQQGSLEIFLGSFADQDERIRSLAAKGLAYYPEELSYLQLAKGLEDSSLAVCLECAKSLKTLGRIELLKDPQMIQYMLDFG